ncbi:hypothetical protein [Lacticaseibacillus kribbianus]|uniref:hypothetical protein n=1 Tax=Lacticaseibacillus kribbianus TaxID=2926292 RepID=UPI001CD2DE5D|nr:hypothetical protein [Lacticaseibacillus kribbianus]
MKIAEMVLTYLHSHPENRRDIAQGYQNVVAFALPDNVLFPYGAEVFPADQLNAFRVPDEFLTEQANLVAWLGSKLDPDEPPVPTELWLTLSHVTAASELYIEASFE